jgi:hypothetical protein
MLLWLSDNRGIYIPRDFATSFIDRTNAVSGVRDEDWKVLEAGPDHEWYWESWDSVLQNAIVNIDGVKHTLHQDGDLWLIPEGMVWCDEKDKFIEA